MDVKVYKEEAEQIKALIDQYNSGQDTVSQEAANETEETADNSVVVVMIIIVVLIIGSIAGLTYWMLN